MVIVVVMVVVVDFILFLKNYFVVIVKEVFDNIVKYVKVMCIDI